MGGVRSTARLRFLPGKPGFHEKGSSRRVVTKATVKISIPPPPPHRVTSQLFPIRVSASCLRPPSLVYKRRPAVRIYRLTYGNSPVAFAQHVVRNCNCGIGTADGATGRSSSRTASENPEVRCTLHGSRYMYIRDTRCDDNKIPSKLRTYSRECLCGKYADRIRSENARGQVRLVTGIK